MSGVVQEAKPFGAFIDLGGGVVGLLPVTEVSQEQVKKIGTVLRDGDSVTAVVINVDTEKGRITFSTKHLEATPGERGVRQALPLAAWLCLRVTVQAGEAVVVHRNITVHQGVCQCKQQEVLLSAS